MSHVLFSCPVQKSVFGRKHQKPEIWAGQPPLLWWAAVNDKRGTSLAAAPQDWPIALAAISWICPAHRVVFPCWVASGWPRRAPFVSLRGPACITASYAISVTYQKSAQISICDQPSGFRCRARAARSKSNCVLNSKISIQFWPRVLQRVNAVQSGCMLYHFYQGVKTL